MVWNWASVFLGCVSAGGLRDFEQSLVLFAACLMFLKKLPTKSPTSGEKIGPEVFSFLQFMSLNIERLLVWRST